MRAVAVVVGAALLVAACGAPEPVVDASAEPAASSRAPSSRAPSSAAASSAPPAAESITVVATGDVLVHQGRALTSGARRPDGGYDFSGVLAPVAPLVEAADLAICHLETPVAPVGGPYRGYPSFVVQPEIIDALAGAGYDLCSTASNHSLDDGLDGLVRTLDALEAAGIEATGTYRSAADSVEPRILDVAGVRVGSVAGTFSLNGVPLPEGAEWSVDVVEVPDVTPMLTAAARARAAGADVVVASLHCCLEYDTDATPAQEEAARTLLASPDVDLVLGHHAHVVQPFLEVDGEWAALGLGNHVAEHATRGHPTEDSVLARFTLTRQDDGGFAVTRAEAVPLEIALRPDRVTVQPAGTGTYQRVAEVLDRLGAVEAGLHIVPE